MTRDLSWGVPVPLERVDGKVLYVWFEAPIGYISATKKLHPRAWEKYWKQEDTKLVHFIGKDNIVFHCLIFPLMLKLHGGYILPEDVPANEFLNLEGKKISTSRNWAVWLHEYMKDFPNQQDTLRYVLCAKMPENKDSNFSWKEFQERNNNELVATLGNFVHRTLHLAQKYTQGRVPKVKSSSPKYSARLGSHLAKMLDLLERCRFQEALKQLLEIAALGNKYLAEHAPWEKDTPDEKRQQIIYDSLQICAILSVASDPFLPNTAKKLRALLNFQKLDVDTAKLWNSFEVRSVSPRSLLLEENDILPRGHIVESPQPLFRRIEDKEIEQQLQKLRTPMEEIPDQSALSSDQEISFETFAQVDMRVATVLRCEVVAGSEKLLRFRLDDGERERVILSGIAAYYKPESLVGDQVIIVKNLRARKIMGELSEGMILCAVAGKRLRLLYPDELIDVGAKIE